MPYQDVTVQCADCNAYFVFTAGEQEFFEQKGLVNVPKRCPECRNARKKSRNSRRPERTMHDVVCSQCGQAAQVPFEPSNEKPVYCKPCFEQMKATV
jgi:CxxC-x17-CxxC domain-containing protein